MHTFSYTNAFKIIEYQNAIALLKIKLSKLKISLPKPSPK